MTQNLATQKMLEELKNQIFDEEHPVNSHAPQFEGEQEPAARKGWRGTWAIDTDYTGRVLVGSGTGFTLGATGGEATHTMTVEELVPHKHFLIAQGYSVQHGTSLITARLDYEVNQNLDHISYTGGGNPFNIMQPYKVVAVWKRIA